MVKEFTQISIPKELHEKLKNYTDENCMKMSPFVEKLINEGIGETENISESIEMKTDIKTKSRIEEIIENSDISEFAEVTVNEDSKGKVCLVATSKPYGFVVRLDSTEDEAIDQSLETLKYWIIHFGIELSDKYKNEYGEQPEG